MTRGHVYRRRLKSGKWSSWYAVIDAPRGRDGKRRQVTRSFPTKNLADEWLAERVGDRRQHDDGPVLVAEYLNDWIRRQEHLGESTKVSYRGHIDTYLIPHLGELPIDSLTSEIIEAVYRHIRALGLSHGTVRRVLATLSAALSSAVQGGVLTHNPAQRIRLKQGTEHVARVWTQDQAVRFLRFVEQDELYPLWRLALITGLRRGELLGLRVRDFDSQTGLITIARTRVVVSGRTVTKEPKTKRSRRTVALDSVTSHLLRDIADSRQDQESHIFLDGSGHGLNPGWVSRRFVVVAAQAGLPPVRFHDLRHTSATLGLARGESLKEVSVRLGHSSVAVTGDLYVQVPTSLAQRSAQALADFLDGKKGNEAA